jgi:hypothetical protein
VQAVQQQRRGQCVGWVHVAAGTDGLGPALLALLDMARAWEADPRCSAAAAAAAAAGAGAGAGVGVGAVLYSLDLSGAIAYLLHALAEYGLQGVPLPCALSSHTLGLAMRCERDDETLFDLIAHNVAGAGACEESALAIAAVQPAVDMLVQALVAELRPGNGSGSSSSSSGGGGWGRTPDRIKYNRTLTLEGLSRMAGLAAANTEGTGSIPRSMVAAGIEVGARG